MGNYDVSSVHTQDEEDYTIDISNLILDVWRGIKKFGWLVILLVIISTSWSCYRDYRFYTPYYTASATFTVNLNEGNNTSIYEDSEKAAQMSKTFPYIVYSELLHNIIAEDLNVDAISESISADNVEGTNLFTIHVSSLDPNQAYDVLQAVIRNYPKVAERVLGSTNLNLLDEPGVPTIPSNQFDIRNSIKPGMLPGLFLGILIIMVYALTRNTIHKVEDLEALSNIKQLGTLPLVTFKKRGKKKSNLISLKNEKLTPRYQESIYKIATRVGKLLELKYFKSIMITSAIPGEGKSTFSFNLAVSLAKEGKKVILVDFDFRRPMVKNFITIPEGALGINDIFQNNVAVKDAIFYDLESNLSVLACLQSLSDSTEIFSSVKILQLITELEESYDYIIMDTPPSAILSDAAELSKYVDGAIFLIKQDYSRVSQIMEGLEHLAESGNVEILGCVLNGVRVGIGSYGYGYGKYGSYGYGNRKRKEEQSVLE